MEDFIVSKVELLLWIGEQGNVYKKVIVNKCRFEYFLESTISRIPAMVTSKSRIFFSVYDTVYGKSHWNIQVRFMINFSIYLYIYIYIFLYRSQYFVKLFFFLHLFDGRMDLLFLENGVDQVLQVELL